MVYFSGVVNNIIRTMKEDPPNRKATCQVLYQNAECQMQSIGIRRTRSSSSSGKQYLELGRRTDTEKIPPDLPSREWYSRALSKFEPKLVEFCEPARSTIDLRSLWGILYYLDSTPSGGTSKSTKCIGTDRIFLTPPPNVFPSLRITARYIPVRRWRPQ